MPRQIKTYTTCAGPGRARSHYNLGGFLGWVVNTMMDLTTVGQVTFVAVFLAAMIALILANPVTALLTFAVLMAELQEAKDWYYKGRLLCIDDQEPCEECQKSGGDCKNTCAIGTVAEATKNNFDGDGVFNLMLAPYTLVDHFRALLLHLDRNKTLLQDPALYDDPPFLLNGGAPVVSTWGSVTIPTSFNPNLLDDPATTADQIGEHRIAVRGFLDRLLGGLQPPLKEIGSNLYNHFLIGVVNRVLTDSVPGFFPHFFRKDPAKIPFASPTWNAIPQDFDDTKDWKADNATNFTPRMPNAYWLPGTSFGLNPMFRFNHTLLAPFLHCEIDGNRVARLLDTVMVTLAAFMATFLVLSAIFGPAIGGLLALALALLAFLIASFVENLPGGGMAGPPDVEYEDEVGDLPTQSDGDVVAAYGRWVMDTEHGEYFEIHPVTAYYVMARDAYPPIPSGSTAPRSGRRGGSRSTRTKMSPRRWPTRPAI